MSLNSCRNAPDYRFPQTLMGFSGLSSGVQLLYFLFICTPYHNPHTNWVHPGVLSSLSTVSAIFASSLRGAFIYLFFNSLSMQECSLSFHEQIWDKCRKLERSVKCQHKGRKWIGIGRVAAVRIAAALCRQLRAIHSHLWALKAPKMETNFTGFIQGNKLGIYMFKHVINWLWIESNS